MDEERSDEQQGEGQKNIRVGIVMGGIMTGVALLFDGLQAICDLLLPVPLAGVAFLVVGWFLGVTAFIAFIMWFGLLGVNYLDRNAAVKIVTLLGSVVAELTPLINALPTITFGVVSLIAISRYEDLHGGVPLTFRGAMRLAVATRLPINHRWLNERLARDKNSRYQVVHKEMEERKRRSKKTSHQFAYDAMTGKENLAPTKTNKEAYRQAQPFTLSRRSAQGGKTGGTNRVHDTPQLREQMRRQAGTTRRAPSGNGRFDGSFGTVRAGRTTINSGGGEVRFGDGAVARGVNSRVDTSAAGPSSRDHSSNSSSSHTPQGRATGRNNEPGFKRYNIGGAEVTTGGRGARVTRNGVEIEPSEMG